MEEINLIEVFQYFKSKILWIIATILIAIIIGNMYTIFTRVPLYKSTTSIVLVNKNYSNDVGAYTQNDLSLNQKLVTTYSEIVKSRRVLEQVIDNLQLACTYQELYSNVSVSSINNTEIIKVQVIYTEADTAKSIANEIAKVFSAEIKEYYNLENVSVLDKAMKAEAPYNLTYTKDNLIYILIGLVLSCGGIFVLYYFDTTIKSTEVVEEKLGLTILGVVPLEKGGK